MPEGRGESAGQGGKAGEDSQKQRHETSVSALFGRVFRLCRNVPESGLFGAFVPECAGIFGMHK